MVARNKVILSGNICGDRWSVGLNLMPQTGSPADLITGQDDLNSAAADVAAALSPVTLSGIASMMTSACNIDEVQVQFFGTDNLLSAQSTPAIPSFGGSGSIKAPPQCALTISLQTGLPGASYRGRIYWPALGASLQNTGRITGYSGLVANYRTLFNTINNELSAYGNLKYAVYSPTKDVLTAVSNIRVGDVLDTQRRRRDAIAETYLTAPIP